MTDTAQIAVAWKHMYSDNTRLALQQTTPKIAVDGDITVSGDVSGEGFRPEMVLGEATVQQRTTRLEERTPQELGMTGRWVEPLDFDCGPYTEDNLDKIRTGIEMSGSFVKSSVAAINRDADRLVLAAMFGSAKTGKNGTGSAAVFDSTNMRVASGSTNMTVAKLVEAKKKLIYWENDLDVEMPRVAMSESQWQSLMNDLKLISGDYNNDKPLKKGVVEEYVGFKIIILSSRRLNLLSSTDRRCPFWMPSGMFMGNWANLETDIYEDKRYRGKTYAVYATYSRGATRLDEKKVGDILCTES